MILLMSSVLKKEVLTSFVFLADLTSYGVKNTKRHPCPYCNYSSSQSSHLKSHVLIHTGERPFHCSLCGRAFTQKSSLKTHMLTHSGTRPYKCLSCGKAFSQKVHLRVHMTTHDAEVE
ncbi:hypothetical protein CEXT_767921 [Caerostris extrusa]|uniref:C2H2-type domain-containing protein n=1 Tax=Caerostris extrusa TaxID=172846 RepID=A0AAV4VAY4_CAEEX|nr:hypothetical protein CEXT_767921 [Caerostris extrusa]